MNASKQLFAGQKSMCGRFYDRNKLFVRSEFDAYPKDYICSFSEKVQAESAHINPDFHSLTAEDATNSRELSILDSKVCWLR